MDLSTTEIALSEGRPRRRPAVAEGFIHRNRVFLPREMANYLHCNVDSLYRNLKHIPHFRVGTEIRFLESAIREWIGG